ncbi:MAG: SGNH/GDSL hydrolase family protein [Ginsengibacter sp.]
MKMYSAYIKTLSHFVIFTFVFLFIISCTKNNSNYIINPGITLDTSKSYLALGDSYTIGESVSDTDRFPAQVVKLLREHKIDITNPDIIAITGWTTGNLLNALNSNPPKKTYSVVTLLIGVNNQYQGKSLNEYKTEFIQLLNSAISYAGNKKNHVFVLSIPDYSVTPFARGSDTGKIAKEIDAFNVANKDISLNAGVHYIDITPISRDAKNDPALIANDGLHPSGIQYKKWSELLVPIMLQEIH